MGKRVIGMREGVMLGTLFTCDRKCGWKGCDSWRTVALECYEQNPDDAAEPVTMQYALCLDHVGAFIDRHILRNEGQILLAESDYVEYEDEPVPDD